MLEKHRGSAECSELAQVSMTEQLSDSENEPPGTRMGAAGHWGTPNPLGELLCPDLTSQTPGL